MWSTGYSARMVHPDPLVLRSVHPARVERRTGEAPELDTLLGPEETDPSAPEHQVVRPDGTGLGCFFWIAGPVFHPPDRGVGLVGPVVF